MTTFSEAEVLFLQARGNEACRRVWLGTFDPRASLPPDSRDPQKLKEFLQEKYERKRWYVAPEPPKPPRSAAAEPPRPLRGDAAPLPQRPPQPAPKAGTDLLADIGGDPFACPAPAPEFAAFPGPAPPRSAFPSSDAFGTTSTGAATFGGAVPPFHVPPTPTGCTNPFTTPRPSRNPFQSSGPGAAFTSPPVPGGFPSPFQADGSPFGGFNVAKASTNPFVTLPTPAVPLGLRHRTTNPFL
uniref:arf-GAP domain and FG repeat-containing protein 2-like n=1 Tax=Lonchura striata TaxID=40157 RepID=UPI000B4CE666|nr:arf-GAP domain and FG repeat-containing protein 2-like [Lonchura striata domestica]